MRFFARSVTILACALAILADADAASLRVAPTSISLVAPDSTSVLSLRNDETRPINVQLRVFRWSSVDGVERLDPTRDVVASPPATTLAPGATTSVRIVRVSSAEIVGEESYRVIVDELPDASRQRGGRIAFVMRYSIPAFFASPAARAGTLEWSFVRRDGFTELVGRNIGDRHVRVSALRVTDRDGRRASLGEGLAGYVLGGSGRIWQIGGRGLSGRSVTVSAMGEAGRIDAVAAAK